MAHHGSGPHELNLRVHRDVFGGRVLSEEEMRAAWREVSGVALLPGSNFTPAAASSLLRATPEQCARAALEALAAPASTDEDRP